MNLYDSDENEGQGLFFSPGKVARVRQRNADLEQAERQRKQNLSDKKLQAAIARAGNAREAEEKKNQRLLLRQAAREQVAQEKAERKAAREAQRAQKAAEAAQRKRHATETQAQRTQAKRPVIYISGTRWAFRIGLPGLSSPWAGQAKSCYLIGRKEERSPGKRK